MGSIFIFGRVGSGRALHPWDNLKQCCCGGFTFMKGKDGVFETGFPYQIVCSKCSSKTKQGDVREIKEEWNIGRFNDGFK